MAVLVVVFAVLVVSYASSMRAFLQQRSHVDHLTAQIASSQQRIGEMKKEKRRWHYNAYVEQQARVRFGWVLPGETAYQVLDADGKPLRGTDELGGPAHKTTHPTAWWSTAYASLETADHPPKPDERPAPIKKIVPPRSMTQ